MKLKKDWTLGHFLYYSSWILLAGILVQFLSMHIALLFGDSSVISTPDIGAFVEVRTEALGIQKTYPTDGKEGFLDLGRAVYVLPSLIMESDESLPGYYVILFLRILKFTALITFYFLLMRILKTVTLKNPFDLRNASRLFIMGGALLALSLFDYSLRIAFSHFFNENLMESSLIFRTSFIGHSGSILFGLVLILLGYFFREATRIHEEQQLTI